MTELKIILTVIQVAGNALIVIGSIQSTKNIGIFGARSSPRAKRMQIYGVVAVSMSTFLLLIAN